ncbi:MAG: hypothetical protein ACXVGO_01130, partial [Mycobacterium sp.]
MWPNKKQQTKTTKHTIEFSNNTPIPTAQPTRGKSHVLEVRTFGNPTEIGASLWEPPRSSGQGPCRSDSDKLREG